MHPTKETSIHDAMRINSIGLLFIVLLFGVEPAGNRMSPVKIYIDEGSHLTIHGQTNLNKFHCQYIETLSDTLSIEVIRDDTHVLTFENARLSLKIMKFDCGNNLINGDFQELLGADGFPELMIEALGIRSIEPSYEKHSLKPVREILSAQIRITIAGNQNDYDLEVSQPETTDQDTYTGSLRVDIRDFGLTPPKKLLGLMQVNQIVDIDFYLKLRPLS